VGSWDAPSEQSWGLDWHCNEGLEITYLAAGKVGFETEHFEGDLKSGSLTITRPWQPHRVGRPHVEASHLLWLILDVGVRRPHQPWQWPSWLGLTGSDLRRLTRILRQNETPVWQANREVREIWLKIDRILTKENDSITYSRLQVYISELLIELLSLLEIQSPQLEDFLSSSERSVELFLKRLSSDPDLAARCHSVGQMARYCDLSEARFGQLCQQLVNQTPGRYLNQVRIHHAQDRLRNCPEISITDVALASGFSSSQYFATVFRQFVGQSPRKWVAEVGR
jgi:AraC family L-rhamnose operon regulatory protein RhaS